MDRSKLCLLAGLLVGLSQEAIAEGIVGLRDSHAGFYAGVRGQVTAGTTIGGIRFRSNDETVLPRVVVARDGGSYRLPAPGEVLWTVSNVTASAGEMAIEMPSIAIDRDQYIWVVVFFPDGAVLRSEGRGGGPGIGWRDAPVLHGERSFFSVDGCLGEFTPALDIGLLTHQAVQAKSVDGAAGAAAAASKSRAAQRGETVVFRVLPWQAASASIEIFDVAGRRVRTLEARQQHEVVWDGRDSHNRPVASGVYLYRLQTASERVADKFVFVR